MTRAEQIVDQVSHTMFEFLMDEAADNPAFLLCSADAEQSSLNRAKEEMQQKNRDDGWNFDIRWCDGDYTDDESYTRVSELTLNDRLFDQCWKEAVEMFREELNLA